MHYYSPYRTYLDVNVATLPNPFQNIIIGMTFTVKVKYIRNIYFTKYISDFLELFIDFHTFSIPGIVSSMSNTFKMWARLGQC